MKSEMILVKSGQKGRMVVDVQTKLLRLGFDIGKTGVDGVFGPETEKAVRLFQSKRGLDIDGVVGPDTWHEIVEATYRLGDRQLYFREPPFRGDDVREVQATLNNLGFNAGRVNGVFGSLSDKAVRDFQKNTGMPVDGIVGDSTIVAMDNLKKRVSSGGITGVWERNGHTYDESELFERRVFVVAEGPGANRIAERLKSIMVREGANIRILTDVESKDALADEANKYEADIVVSIEFNSSEEEARRGSTCYYFDNGEYFSSRSKQIAEMVQSQLCGGLPLFDNGIEGKNWTVLRATRIPAVVVRPAYISNKSDAKVAEDEIFTDQAAQAIVNALRRYWHD
jgi:N-acetylmuramoyl-L-alanine amidase